MNVLLSLFFVPAIVVNSPQFDASVAGANLDKAAVKAIAEAPGIVEIRDYALLRWLIKDWQPRGWDVPERAYRLDVAGNDVDPLARALYLGECTFETLSIETYTLCVSDFRKLDETAATARATEIAQDPFAKALAGRKLPAMFARIKARFAAFEKESAGYEGFEAVRDVALGAYDAFQTDVITPLGATWDEARAIEELELFGAAPASFADCDKQLTEYLTRSFRDYKRDELLAAIRTDPRLSIPFGSRLICLGATGRPVDLAAYSSVGTDMNRMKFHNIPRGPRMAALVAADRLAREHKDEWPMQMQVVNRMQLSESFTRVQTKWGSRIRADLYSGVLAKVEKRGATVILRFKPDRIPDMRYGCSGSNKITGVHVIGKSIGIDRDVSCGWVDDGRTVDVRPEPIQIPAASAAGLRAGLVVEIRVPQSTEPQSRSDTVLLNGRQVRTKRKMTLSKFDEATVTYAFADKERKKLVVLLGTALDN
jgi:hypothetical protein